MGVSGKRIERKEYDEIKKYIRRKYAQRDIQKLCQTSTNVIGAVKNSRNYEEFYEKQYGEPLEGTDTNKKASDMYKYQQVIGTLREQGKLLLEIKSMLHDLIEELH